MSTTDVEEGAVKRRILFAIDENETCKQVFKLYVDRIMLPGDQITFVHVMEPDPNFRGASSSSTEPGKTPKKAFDEVLNRSKSLGISYIAMAKAFKLETSAFLHVHTRPGRALLTSARHHDSNMIVIGSGGLGPPRRNSLGSVSDYVVHNSPIPVVVIYTDGHS
nr:universal stress protein [Hymenolepis microstoma]